MSEREYRMRTYEQNMRRERAQTIGYVVGLVVFVSLICGGEYGCYRWQKTSCEHVHGRWHTGFINARWSYWCDEETP